jgi:hypothetical protein
MIETFEEPESWPDYHATFTIQLCELVDGGIVDFHKEPFALHKYSAAQFERVIGLLQEHYYYREISCLPVRRWMREFNRKWNEIAPKYDALYKALDDGVSPLSAMDEWEKGRDIFSDFPQTMLSDNEDYASHGTDFEHEKLAIGDFMGTADRLQRAYDTVDTRIIKDMGSLFVHLVSANFNGY